MNTPDTEEKIKQIVEKVRYVEFLHGVPVELPNRTKELLRSSIREAISSRDTYWKERVEEIYGHFSWCQECAEGPMCKDALAIKDNLK